MAIEVTLSPDLEKATAAMLNAIGMRIRAARRTRKLTLQALSAASGLSTSMLSLVERGRASPSIASLMVIASALELTVPDLLVADPNGEETIVTRAGKGRHVETPEHMVTQLLKQDRASGVSVSLTHFAARGGGNESPASHDGFEYGYVLDGVLSVEVDGAVHDLGPGDLIAYQARRMHRIWNPGDVETRALWFNLEHE